MAVLGSGSSITEALGRVSPREKRLLALLALIVLILVPLKAIDLRATALARNDAAQDALAVAKAAARRSGGEGVTAQLQRTREEIAEWSWAAPSVAVGQVIAQNALAEMARDGGLAGAEARAVGRPEAAGAVTMVGVEVKAPFSWPGLSGFLEGLAESGKGFVVESVAMSGDKEPKLTVVVRLPVMIAEAAPA